MSLNELFAAVEEQGGNLLVPTYSYSFTKKEVFSLRDTKSDLGKVSDFLRAENPSRRTCDPNFSYLSFGTLIDRKFFSIQDYASFGPDSLMGLGLENDSYLLSVGSVLHHCTEIHHLEKTLEVPYRFDKNFSGKTQSLDGAIHDQTVTYYCRDLDFAKKYNSTTSFERLVQDMKKENLVESYEVEGVLIEAVRYQTVHAFLKKKIPHDLFYLMKDISTNSPIRA